MRIGILTLPLHTNYGGILQAYALQTVLERMGHEVKVIKVDRNNKLPLWKKPLSYSKRVIEKYIFHKKVRIFAEKYERISFPIVTQYTQRFIDENIHLLKIKKLEAISESQFDAIVVGSDQIWRPKYYQNIQNAFLKFAKNWNIRRLSYAASFGNSIWEFNSKQTKECTELLKLFDFVSVREKSGCNLCRDYLHHDAYHVLDPTLLLNKEDYMQIAKTTVNVREKKLMVYLLDEKTDTWSHVLKFAQIKGLTPIKSNSSFEDFFASLEDRIQPPVEDWLNGFINSDAILTDSFHACVFSIIFGKEFYVIGNKIRGMDRFSSLLDLFGLSNRLFESIDSIDTKMQNIDYDTLNEQLHRLKNNSILLLEQALNIDKYGSLISK